MAGGLGMDGGRMGSLYTGILYPGCLREGPSLKGGVGVGDTGIRVFNSHSESVGVGYGCSIHCELGSMISLLMPTFPYPFLGWTGENTIWGWGTD